MLADYGYKTEISTNGANVNRELRAFLGEQFFNANLLAVTSDKPLNACFLTGHREFDPRDSSIEGFSSFATLLLRSYVKPEMLQLLGTNAVPANCDLLIIAGPKTALTAGEIEKIKQYLARNGARLLVLFDEASLRYGTGLEPLLADWGVEVGRAQVKDPNHGIDSEGTDFIVASTDGKHPVLVHSIIGEPLQMVRPRSVGKLKSAPDTPGAPRVDELVFAEAGSFLEGDPTPFRLPVPLAVAVEKEREGARIVVVGDTKCFDNQLLASSSNCNEDFGNGAINWLLNRSQIMGNIGPRTVTEYAAADDAPANANATLCLFLVAMPGGILALGGLVWLRRRH